MHNVSRLGSRQGFTRQILIDKGVKAFPQSRFCHSREETSMNLLRFQQGICYLKRKFPPSRPVGGAVRAAVFRVRKTVLKKRRVSFLSGGSRAGCFVFLSHGRVRRVAAPPAGGSKMGLP